MMTPEKIDQLEGLLDSVDPSTYAIIVSLSVGRFLQGYYKYSDNRPYTFGNNMVCHGRYNKVLVIIDNSMDSDDVRIFNEHGKALFNLILDGFLPDDFGNIKFSFDGDPDKFEEQFTKKSA